MCAASKDVSYALGSAHAIPFGNDTFDAVVAFSAYHWFQDAASAAEIKRILKQSGQLIVVQNKDDKAFKSVFTGAIARYAAVAKQPDDYGTPDSLRSNGFSDITVKEFLKPDLYTLDGIVEWVHSISLWGAVPKENEAACDQELRAAFKSLAKDGVVTRNRAVVVYSSRV